jgi:hypothetical protein
VEDILKSFRKRRRIKWADPGPFDLTLKKVRERMEKIRVGDVIRFYSIAECFTLSQLDRHNTKIPAVGRVVAIPSHRRFIVVELPKGVRESVSCFDIEKVNGVPNPLFVKGGDCIDTPRPGRPHI